MSVIQQNTEQGLYSPDFEHDNCGIGAVVNIKGQKSHDTVANALKIVENLEHRAGKDAEGKTGDGVGILAIRSGVSASPSLSGSSPIPSSKRRIACSTFL